MNHVIQNIVTQERETLPKYVVVRDWLARRINAGEIQPGSRLPSEHSLVRKFGVSRVTVRHALDALKKSGMVESHQGQGHFVRGVKAELDMRRLQGLGEALGPNGVAATARLLERTEVKANAQVRQALGIPAGTAVTAVRRLRLANGAPVCHEERFLLNEVAEPLTEGDLESSDVCTLLERSRGVPIAFGDVIMDMVKAAPRMAAMLDIEPGDTVVRTEQVNFDVNGVAIDFCIRHAVAEAFRYRTRIGRW
ncbi:MAG: GntR family transcriptional regulator [Rhodospirillaceae bacterium]|nr:GntR family transcriptional regulator [Rhodospirillaceae bacterium]